MTSVISVGGKALGAQNILRQLGVSAGDLGFGISKEFEPGLIDGRKILGRAGIDQNVVASSSHKVDQGIQFLASVPIFHPIDFGSWYPKRTAVEYFYGIVHGLATSRF